MTKPGTALTCGMVKGRTGPVWWAAFPLPGLPPHSRVWTWFDAHTHDSCKGSRLLNGNRPDRLSTPRSSPPPPASKHKQAVSRHWKNTAAIWGVVERECLVLARLRARCGRSRTHTPRVVCGEGPPGGAPEKSSTPAPVLLASVIQTTVRPGARPARAAVPNGGGGRPTPRGHEGDRAPHPSGGLSLSSAAPPCARTGALRVDGLPRARTPAPLLATGLWWRVVPPVP